MMPGLACADPGAMAPIGASGNFDLYFLWDFGISCGQCQCTSREKTPWSAWADLKNKHFDCHLSELCRNLHKKVVPMKTSIIRDMLIAGYPMSLGLLSFNSPSWWDIWPIPALQVCKWRQLTRPGPLDHYLYVNCEKEPPSVLRGYYIKTGYLSWAVLLLIYTLSRP